jgi:hypothetical protein
MLKKILRKGITSKVLAEATAVQLLGVAILLIVAALFSLVRVG